MTNRRTPVLYAFWLFTVILIMLIFRPLSADYVNYQSAPNSIENENEVQGNLESDFTRTMPIATIYVDENIVNINLHKQPESVAYGELLVDSDVHPGMKLDTENPTSESYGWLYFDFKAGESMPYGTGSTGANFALFSGPVVRYTIPDAGEIYNPETGDWDKLDVLITYSNMMISLPTNLNTTNYNRINRLNILDTNYVYPTFSGTGIGTNNNHRAGLKFEVNVQIRDKDGNLVDGTFYFPMLDIDVDRSSQNGFTYLYEAAANKNYSEQVELLGNFDGRIWIPGGNFDKSQDVDDELNRPYLSQIGSPNGNLVVYPGTPYKDVHGNPPRKDDDFYTGFMTLGNNSAGGINFRFWSTAAGTDGCKSYIMSGRSKINLKVAASTNIGGSIATTTTGNHSGDLISGTLIPTDGIMYPKIISPATGQTVKYTMVPEPGYRIKDVYISDVDTDIMQKVVAGTVSPIDRSTDPFFSVDTKGTGVYSFENLTTDKSIHVEWEPTDLKVTKAISETEDAETDTFTFDIRVWDPAPEMVKWKVNAWEESTELLYSFNVLDASELEYGQEYLLYESSSQRFVGWDKDAYSWVSQPQDAYSSTTNFEVSDKYIWTLEDSGTGSIATDAYIKNKDADAYLTYSEQSYYTEGRPMYVENEGFYQTTSRSVVWKNDALNVIAQSDSERRMKFATYTTTPQIVKTYFDLSSAGDYTEVDGEPGVYVITLPKGQTPDVSSVIPAGYLYSAEPIAAPEYDITAAMTAKGLVPVAGTTDTFRFTLTNDQTLDLEQVIPFGWSYTVTEISSPRIGTLEGWKLKNVTDNASAAAFDGEEAVTFTNERNLYDLTVKKETVDNETGTFPFRIKVWRTLDVTENEYQRIGELGSREDDVKRLSFSVGDKAVIVNGYTFEANSKNELIMDGCSHTYPTVANDLTYTSDAEIPQDWLEAMRVLFFDIMYGPLTSAGTVVNTDGYYNGAGNVSAGESSYAPCLFELHTWEEQESTVLPSHLYHSDDHAAAYVPVPKTTTQTVYFDLSSLFGAPVEEGVYAFTLDNGGTVTIPDIPEGYQYEITENVPENWRLNSSVNSSGSISADTTATFTDENLLRNVTLKKNWSDDSDSHRTRPEDLSGFIKYQETGQPEVTADTGTEGWTKDGDTWTRVFAIPKNAAVTDWGEAAVPAGYDFTKVPNDGTSAVYEITNALRTFELTVNKNTVEDKTGSFIFKLKISRKVGGTTVTPDLTGVQGLRKLADGEYLFSLSNGGSLTIPDIPYGYSYEVLEQTPLGWTLQSVDGDESKAGASGSFITDGTYEHTFLNRKDETEITVVKNTTERDGTFKFKARVIPAPTVPGKLGKLSLTDDGTERYHYLSVSPVITALKRVNGIFLFQIPEEFSVWINTDVTGALPESSGAYAPSVHTFAIGQKVTAGNDPSGAGWLDTLPYSAASEAETINGRQLYKLDKNLYHYRLSDPGMLPNPEIWEISPSQGEHAFMSSAPAVVEPGDIAVILQTDYELLDSFSLYASADLSTVDWDGGETVDLYVVQNPIEYEFSITTTGGTGSYTIPEVPFGTYEIWEEVEGRWMLVSIDGDGTNRDRAAGTISTTEPLTHTFLDTPFFDLTVSKSVAGPLASRDQYFSVTISLSDILTEGDLPLTYGGGASTVLEDTPYNSFNGASNPSVLTVTDGTGEVTVWLRHGENVSVSLPNGSKYNITELASGHTASHTITAGGTASGPVSEVSTGEQTLSDETAVAFTNTLDQAPPTGVFDSISSVFWILLAAFALAILPAASRKIFNR